MNPSQIFLSLNANFKNLLSYPKGDALATGSRKPERYINSPWLSTALSAPGTQHSTDKNTGDILNPLETEGFTGAHPIVSMFSNTFHLLRFGKRETPPDP